MSAPQPRAAVLAGATGGIGAEFGRVLIEEGYGVTLSGRRLDRLEDLAGRLRSVTDGRADPARVSVCAADLTTPSAAERLVHRHVETHDSLDVLVVAAGGGRPSALDESGSTVWRRQLDLNVLATAELVAASLPSLRRSASAGRGPLVVLLASVVASRPLAGFAAYSAAKAAIVSLARSLNEEESDGGIRATALSPGYVHTPLTAGLAGADAFLPAADIGEALRFLLRLSPLARVPEIEIGRCGAGTGRP